MRALPLLLLSACTTLAGIQAPDKVADPDDTDVGDTDVVVDTDADTDAEDTDVDDTDAEDTDPPGDTVDTGLTGCAVCDPGALPFGGGSGSPADPSLICSPAQLDSLRSHSSHHAELCNDIDLYDTALDPIPVFSGVLDGQGYAIRGLTFDRPTQTDLAFVVDLSGMLTNLRFQDATVRSYSHSAVLARRTLAGGSVRRVHVDGTVTGDGGHIAGLVVSVSENSLVADSSFDGDVVNGSAGGFVGGLIDGCSGTARKLEARGTLTSGAWKLGCIVQGLSPTGVVEGSVCRMNIEALNRSGGIVGVLNGGTILGSYFEGRIHGEHWIGGVVGETWGAAGRIEQSYASGLVLADFAVGNIDAAGLVAYNGPGVTVVDSVWDVDSTGVTANTIGGQPLTTAEMQDPTNPAFANWGTQWNHAPGDHPRLPWE
jgi:hypothetical protein